MDFEYIILVVFLLGALIFYALDFKFGVLMQFFIFGALFMWMYKLEMNYKPFLIIFFISVVLMAFSLFFAQSSAKTAGGMI